VTANAAQMRDEVRINRSETIFLEVRPRSRDRSVPPTIVMCNSRDISASGIRVVLQEEIVIGSVLRLCVDMKQFEPICLAGEVNWGQPDAKSDEFSVGLSLLDAEDSDIQHWKEIVADLVANMSMEIPASVIQEFKRL